MNSGLLFKIRNNSYLYSFLREESYHYKYLYRDDNYIKEIEKLAKEKYKMRSIDKIERLKNNIDLIKTFISVME